MHLDKRLQAVASFVPQGAAFADIGPRLFAGVVIRKGHYC